jgi:hypothetical protein
MKPPLGFVAELDLDCVALAFDLEYSVGNVSIALSLGAHHGLAQPAAMWSHPFEKQSNLVDRATVAETGNIWWLAPRREPCAGEKSSPPAQPYPRRIAGEKMLLADASRSVESFHQSFGLSDSAVRKARKLVKGKRHLLGDQAQQFDISGPQATALRAVRIRPRRSIG